MKEVTERDRPREKIRSRGPASLSNQELIAAILGSGNSGRDVRDMSQELALILDERRATLNYEDLKNIRGMGPAKVSQIIACMELGRRYYKKDENTKIINPKEFIRLVKEFKKTH